MHPVEQTKTFHTLLDTVFSLGIALRVPCPTSEYRTLLVKDTQALNVHSYF